MKGGAPARVFAVLLCLFLAIAGALGATTQVLQPPASDEVFVDVAVTTASGAPVRTLSREDFEVYEDGVRQNLRSFARVETPFRVLIIDECSGRVRDPRFGYPKLQNYYLGDRVGDSVPFSFPELPLQSVVEELTAGLRDQHLLALAEFDAEFKLLRDWSDRGGLSGPIQLRAVGEAFGPDCADSHGMTTGRFEEKLRWIATQLKGASGRKAVIWVGPPKNLPGEFRETRLQTRGAPVVPFAQEPEIRTIREAIADMGEAFFFVLTRNEFAFTYPEDAARHQRRYLALKAWAEVSGGDFVLIETIGQVSAMTDRLRREPPTTYRLSYRSLAREGRYTNGRVEVRVSSGELSVLHSGSFNSD